MTIFRGAFQSVDDVMGAWGRTPPDGAEMVYANYDVWSYEGNGRIVYTIGEEVYVVEDWHCSCRGLEVWEPKPTTRAMLATLSWVQEDAELLAWCEGR